MSHEDIFDDRFYYLSDSDKREILTSHSAGSHLGELGIITPHHPEIANTFGDQTITSEHPVFVMSRIPGESVTFNTQLLGGLPGIDTATNFSLVNGVHRLARNASWPLLYSNGLHGALTAFFPREYYHKSVGILYGGTNMCPEYFANSLKIRYMGIDIGHEEIGSLFILMTKRAVVIINGGMNFHFTERDIAGYEQAISNHDFKRFLSRQYMRIPTAEQLSDGIGKYISVH